MRPSIPGPQSRFVAVRHCDPCGRGPGEPAPLLSVPSRSSSLPSPDSAWTRWMPPWRPRSRTRTPHGNVLSKLLEATIPLGDRYHFLAMETLDDPGLQERHQADVEWLGRLVDELKEEGAVAAEVPRAWATANIDAQIWLAWSETATGNIAPRAQPDWRFAPCSKDWPHDENHHQETSRSARDCLPDGRVPADGARRAPGGRPRRPHRSPGQRCSGTPSPDWRVDGKGATGGAGVSGYRLSGRHTLRPGAQRNSGRHTDGRRRTLRSALESRHIVAGRRPVRGRLRYRVSRHSGQRR